MQCKQKSHETIYRTSSMIDKTTIYDNFIELPVTPAFEPNIQAMFQILNDDGVTSPTSTIDYTDQENPVAVYHPQVGTVADTGKQMFHFRTRDMKRDVVELLDYLESPMTAPIPPISVLAIQSGFPIVESDLGTPEEPEIVYEFDVVKPMVRTEVTRYFRIQDYNPDGTPVGNPRPPQAGDQLPVSKYDGGMDIIL